MKSKVKKAIRDVDEKALQRAILSLGYSKIGNTTINWLDIELPVVKEITSRRRPSIDLIGEYNGGFVLCELKFKNKSNSDSPEDAVKELEGYCEQIVQNYDFLDTLDLHHEDCQMFSWTEIKDSITDGRVMKIIAANHEYWKHWLSSGRGGTMRSDIKSIKEQGYILCSIDVNSDCFEVQKGSLESYLPSIEIDTWSLL